jgi:hypothetical protein
MTTTTTTIVCEKTSRPYRREEDDEIIRWFKDNSIIADFCFRKSDGIWRYHGYPFQLSKALESPPDIELQYQETLTKSNNKLYAIYDRFNATTTIVRATSLESAKRIFEEAKDTKDFWIQELASVDGEEGIIYD